MLGKLLIDLLRGRWRPVAGSAGSNAPAVREPVVSRHRPEVFDVVDEAEARAIILTPEGGRSTETRWEQETPYLARLAIEALGPRPGMRIVDYGCGIGRLARELIASTGCDVVGVDISPSMRELAVRYVGSRSFEAIDAPSLARRTAGGERCDGAIACWVLQHCMDAAGELDVIRAALRPGGRFLVVNNLRRAMPSDRGWVDDGIDVAALLDVRFRRIERRALDPAAVGDAVATHAYAAVYERP
jgi:SAM-dependent methyltransferase